MGKIKISIVGCGRISQNHISALQNLSSDFEINAICDTDSSKLEETAGKLGVKPYRSLETLLKDAKPDIVSLCTPSGIHPLQTILSARHGVHVLTEKPMACRYDHAVEAIHACDEAGTKLFVVKQNRLNEPIQLLKNAIEKGRFGRIHMITANVFWTRPQDYYDQAKWRGTWEFDGGAFMNQASHYVDMLTYLGGPLQSVHAFTGTLGRKIEAEDCGVIALKWRSGAMGSINVTMLTYPKNLEGSITILGEKGTARIGGVALNKIEAWQFSDNDPSDAAAQNASYETGSVYGFGHQSYYAELAKALRGEPNQAVSGREGLISLQTIVAAYRSAANGSPVSLPLGI
jgi:UDP-N-acetyl-2-amino-2-deoxyglucuronate dehydrogenase